MICFGDKTMTLLTAINTEYNPVGKITFDSSHCKPLLLILRRLILLLCSRLISILEEKKISLANSAKVVMLCKI